MGNKRRLTITLNDYQVSGWKILYINELTNAVNIVNENVNEYIETVGNKTITLIHPAFVNSNVLYVSTNNVEIGERYLVGDIVYRIVDVDGEKIYLHKPLQQNFSVGASFNKVGNLGVYYVDIIFPEPGSYVVLVSNYSYNILNYHVKVIIDNTLTSINNKIDILLSIQSAQNIAQVFV